MATILEFITDKFKAKAETAPEPRMYNVEVSAFPGNYLEFTANGVRTDTKSLSRIADELEKIASIIRSDIIMTDAPAT